MHLLYSLFFCHQHQTAYHGKYMYIGSNAFLPVQMFMNWIRVHWIDIMYLISPAIPMNSAELLVRQHYFCSILRIVFTFKHIGKSASIHTMKYKPHSFPIHSSMRVHGISFFFVSIFFYPFAVEFNASYTSLLHRFRKNGRYILQWFGIFDYLVSNDSIESSKGKKTDKQWTVFSWFVSFMICKLNFHIIQYNIVSHRNQCPWTVNAICNIKNG